MKKFRLTTQIVLILTFVSGLTAISFDLLIRSKVDALVLQKIDERNEALLEYLEYSLETIHESGDQYALNRILSNLGSRSDIREIAVVDSSNMIIAHSNRNKRNTILNQEQFSDLKEAVQAIRFSNLTQTLYIEDERLSLIIKLVPISGGDFSINQGRSFILAVLDVTAEYKDIKVLNLFIDFSIFSIFLLMIVYPVSAMWTK